MILTPDLAAARALSLLGRSYYQLGTGDCDTPDDGPFDCVGLAICKAYNMRRHVPGFNRGSWATVSDDINSNSATEDALHNRQLFMPAATPAPGVLLCYPTIRVRDNHGAMHEFIGHAAIVVDVPRSWDGTYASLAIVQTIGPNGRRPGVIRSTGKHFDDHDVTWPTHKTSMIVPVS